MLEVGERVLSIEVATGRIVESTIVAVRRAARECLALRWGAGELVCTPDHPLYDPDRGAYRPAADWLTGGATRLLVCAGEVAEAIVVAATEVFAGVHEVVDLSLADGPHNFIAAGVVVHNKSLVIPYDPPVQVAERIDGPAFELNGDGARREFRLRACLDDDDHLGYDATIEVEVTATTTAKFEQGGGPSLSLLVDSAPGEPEIGELPTTLYFADDAPGDSCGAGIQLAFLQFEGPQDAVVSVTWEAQVIAYHEDGAEGRLEVTIEPVD